MGRAGKFLVSHCYMALGLSLAPWSEGTEKKPHIEGFVLLGSGLDPLLSSRHPPAPHQDVPWIILLSLWTRIFCSFGHVFLALVQVFSLFLTVPRSAPPSIFLPIDPEGWAHFTPKPMEASGKYASLFSQG